MEGGDVCYGLALDSSRLNEPADAIVDVVNGRFRFGRHLDLVLSFDLMGDLPFLFFFQPGMLERVYSEFMASSLNFGRKGDGGCRLLPKPVHVLKGSSFRLEPCISQGGSIGGTRL